MSIKQNGGVFGRNPTFNDVTIEGDLIINGEVFTGLDFQGSWNASTNTPALASSTGTNGEFYIVSVAGSTDLNGITNWGIGDWAIFNGTAWQRVEGGADGNFNDLTAKNLTVSDTGVPEIKIEDTDGTNTKTLIKHSNGTTQLVSQNGASHGTTLFQTYNGSDTVTRQRIASNGDISFYEDTGTTAKFFWDASTSQLFLGATSASALNTFGDDLVVVNTAAGTGAGISIIANATNGYSNLYFGDTADGDVGRVQYNHGNNSMTFRTNAADGLVIDSSQNVSIPNGDLTIASGNGVYLGGTGTANKLDDYEEGEFAVTLTPSTSGSIALQTGADTMLYNKVGRVVHCQGQINVQSIASAVGSSIAVNLPFAKLNTTDASEASSGQVTYYNTSAYSVLPAYVPSSVTQAFNIVIDPSTLANGHLFYIQFSYTAA